MILKYVICKQLLAGDIVVPLRVKRKLEIKSIGFVGGLMS